LVGLSPLVSSLQHTNLFSLRRLIGGVEGVGNRTLLVALGWLQTRGFIERVRRGRKVLYNSTDRGKMLLRYLHLYSSDFEPRLRLPPSPHWLEAFFGKASERKKTTFEQFEKEEALRERLYPQLRDTR
jgi:hypothetical protein